MEWIAIPLIIVLLVVVGGIAWAVGAYNGFVKQRNLIQESWRQVDVELNRRYELIPNLVETVRAFAGHERNTLEGIVRLRQQAQQLSSAERGDAPSAERAAVRWREPDSGAASNSSVWYTGIARGGMGAVRGWPDGPSRAPCLPMIRPPPGPPRNGTGRAPVAQVERTSRSCSGVSR